CIRSPAFSGSARSAISPRPAAAA
ncbi:MAG: hypothetical protein AVDCRST_MAG40-1528, partial [uncultured Gemmatimonadaceae bacterium]